MNSITIKGYLQIELEISVQGNLTKEDSDKIQTKLMNYLKRQDFAYKGRFKHVEINTFETEKSNIKLDTSTS